MAEMKEEPAVYIENLVGTVRLKEEGAEDLDLAKLYLALDPLFVKIESGLYEELKGVIYGPSSLEYNPERFAAIMVRLRKPKASINIFRSRAITCTGCCKIEDLKSAVKIAVELIKLALPMETISLKSESLPVEISNVVCSANIGRPLGCGIVQKAFPGVEVKINKFAGGSYNISRPGGKIMIFASGRMMTAGFKDIELAQKTALEAVQAVRQALNEYGEENREQVCRVERFDPTSKLIEEYAATLGISEKVKVKAIELVRQYCMKVTRGTFGGATESFAAAAIYIACILCDQRLTQMHIYGQIGVSEVAIRSARDKIKDVLEIEILL